MSMVTAHNSCMCWYIACLWSNTRSTSCHHLLVNITVAALGDKLQMICNKCGEQTVVSPSQPSGRNASLKPRIDNVCFGITRANCNRTKKDAASRAWWASLSPGPHLAWYRKQKEVEAPQGGKGRQVDDTVYAQHKIQHADSPVRTTIHWQPFDEFETICLIRSEDAVTIRQMWRDLVSDPGAGAKEIHGVMCAPHVHWCDTRKHQRTAS